MNKSIWFLVLAVISSASFAQTGTEILLFDVKLKKNAIVISKPINITNHPGYDNQPHFNVDHPVVYYSSFDEAGRADILSYNFKTKKTERITSTSEREYSPTLTPDRQYLSCIIQRDDGAQDLGKYPVTGGDPFVIIDNLKVGYHAWADDSHIAVFVLGATESDPSTLHYLRLPTKADTIVATNIGRSLHKVPGRRSISFIQRNEKESKIMRLDTETMKVSVIAPTVANGDDITWTPLGQLVTSDGTKLVFMDPAQGAGWRDVEIKDGAELLKGVTRLAVSPNGKKMAVVIAE